jgi:hypothetical protein
MYAHISSADVRSGGTIGRTPLSVVADVCWGTIRRTLVIICRTL